MGEVPNKINDIGLIKELPFKINYNGTRRQYALFQCPLCPNTFESIVSNVKRGKGITVCARWVNSFKIFCIDMGAKPTPKHSIDRIDTNGNYEPSNCRWATNQEQVINTNIRTDNTSGYKGITFDKVANKYRARVKHNGKLLDAGRYNSIDKAVAGRNEYINKHGLPHTIQ